MQGSYVTKFMQMGDQQVLLYAISDGSFGAWNLNDNKMEKAPNHHPQGQYVTSMSNYKNSMGSFFISGDVGGTVQGRTSTFEVLINSSIVCNSIQQQEAAVTSLIVVDVGEQPLTIVSTNKGFISCITGQSQAMSFLAHSNPKN
jgi:hypothetical protein